MARAGFWAIGGYRLRFGRDGRWYADDEVIANRRIALLFSRHLFADGKGGWVIDVGVDRQPVIVEDAPLVVTRLEDDREAGLRVRTNDGESSDLDCTTLEVGEGYVLYCTVERERRGRMRARFLRPAYYALARYVEWEDERPVLRYGGKAFAIGRAAAAAGGAGDPAAG